MSLPMSLVSAQSTGVRYEIRWRRVTEIVAMSASLAGVVAFVFWGG